MLLMIGVFFCDYYYSGLFEVSPVFLWMKLNFSIELDSEFFL